MASPDSNCIFIRIYSAFPFVFVFIFCMCICESVERQTARQLPVGGRVQYCTQCGTHRVGSDHTVHTDVVKCGVLWCSTVGWGLVLRGMVPCGTVLCSVARWGGVWCSVVHWNEV